MFATKLESARWKPDGEAHKACHLFDVFEVPPPTEKKHNSQKCPPKKEAKAPVFQENQKGWVELLV